MSEYIIECPDDGERATVSKTADGYLLECPKCHRAEYGAEIGAAARCFAVSMPRADHERGKPMRER